MDYNEVLAKARTNIGPYCKACPVCNGRACGNSMPGPGSKNPGNGAARNYDAWQKVFVNMDTICDHDAPSTKFAMFGREFDLPVFTAPIGALPMHYSDAYDDFAYNDILIPASVECGSMAFRRRRRPRGHEALRRGDEQGRRRRCAYHQALERRGCHGEARHP